MVLEKSWNVQYWQRVMEFCYQSWNFTNFPPKLYEMCMSFAATKKISIRVEVCIFQCFLQNASNMENDNRDGHGKLKNGH